MFHFNGIKHWTKVNKWNSTKTFYANVFFSVGFCVGFCSFTVDEATPLHPSCLRLYHYRFRIYVCTKCISCKTNVSTHWTFIYFTYFVNILHDGFVGVAVCVCIHVCVIRLKAFCIILQFLWFFVENRKRERERSEIFERG